MGLRLSENTQTMTNLNSCIFQCEQAYNRDNILVYNDECEINFFDRFYASLLEKTPKIEELNAALKFDQYYYTEAENISSTLVADQRNEILENYKLSKKLYLNIKNYLDDPLFLKHQLLQIFTNLLVYQQNSENFRKKFKSQLRCLFSLMILSIEYKKNFQHDKINRAKGLITKCEQNKDKNFLDLINQWIEVYVDLDSIRIDAKFMENFSLEFFDYDNPKLFFENAKNSAAFLSLCLFYLMNKHGNFVEMMNHKSIVNTFIDSQRDMRSILKENNELSIEFYTILIVNILFNESFLDKIQINLEVSQINDSMEREMPCKKKSIIQSLLDTKFIDSQILAGSFCKVFENLFEISYYLSFDDMLISNSFDLDHQCFFESNYLFSININSILFYKPIPCF